MFSPSQGPTFSTSPSLSEEDEAVLRISKITGWLVVGLILLIVLCTSIVKVKAGYVGVVTQFGRVTGREMQPGLNIKAPWPIQGVWKASTQVQKEQVDASAASTDLQQVSSVIAVNYHLEAGRLSSIYQNLSVDYKNRIIDPAIQETFKAATAKFTAAELLNKRAEVKDVSDTMLKERLGKYGIVVDDLSIVNFNFSEEYNNAIEAKQVAQQDAEKAYYKLEQAKKEAAAQEVQKQSLSQELLTKMFIEKWNGTLPTYMGTNNIFGVNITK